MMPFLLDVEFYVAVGVAIIKLCRGISGKPSRLGHHESGRSYTNLPGRVYHSWLIGRLYTLI